MTGAAMNCSEMRTPGRICGRADPGVLVARRLPDAIDAGERHLADAPSALEIVAFRPWYPVFKGERINNHRTTLAEKQAAREALRKGAAE